MEKMRLINQSLSVQVARELEKRVASGEWAIGSRIPSEAHLMELFGVSRNTVREAIRFLVISGVVHVRQGDGTYVQTQTVFNASIQKRLQEEEIRNILETRSVLEPRLVEMATERGTPQEIETLETCYNELQAAYGGDFQQFVDKDTEFHVLIAEMAHNPLLADLFKAIVDQLSPFIKEGYHLFQISDVPLFLHKDLFVYIKNKDAGAARRNIERMIELEKDILHDANLL
ncbi:MAG: GntR family transcriptional regulator [Desulfobacterales bacterium]|nr:MAG: GntR family transcriptional regulator [Desulfobacterales bacterium]